MSSTSTYTGSNSAKPSSRVLRPPGGGSSIVFGGGVEDNTSRKNTGPSHETVVSQSDPVATLVQPSREEPNEVKAVQPAGMIAAQPAEMPCPSQPRGRGASSFNPITGEPYNNAAVTGSQQQQSTTSIGIRQPPGGASTRLW